jgi:hypothetical protein
VALIISTAVLVVGSALALMAKEGKRVKEISRRGAEREAA